jgi:hypothetical protein
MTVDCIPNIVESIVSSCWTGNSLTKDMVSIGGHPLDLVTTHELWFMYLHQKVEIIVYNASI